MYFSCNTSIGTLNKHTLKEKKGNKKLSSKLCIFFLLLKKWTGNWYYTTFHLHSVQKQHLRELQRSYTTALNVLNTGHKCSFGIAISFQCGQSESCGWKPLNVCFVLGSFKWPLKESWIRSAFMFLQFQALCWAESADEGITGLPQK